MKLNFLLPMVALVPATLAGLWGGRDDDVAKLDDEDLHPVDKRTVTTTTYLTVDEPTGSWYAVSTVVLVEHLYTTPGYSTWVNADTDAFGTTSTTFTTTTVTHIPHIVYLTSDWDKSKIQLAKRSTVSITDWVTITRDPDNPEGTSEASSSSSTLPPLGSPQAPPSSPTGRGGSATRMSSAVPRPANSSTSASQSPSSTSAVSGAPPITASSEASTSTPTMSAVSSSSSSKAAPPAPVTSTAPIPSSSLTEPAAPPSSSESLSAPSSPLPPLSSSDLFPSETPDDHPHRSTLWTLTTGFSAPRSSTLTFVMPSHEGTHLSVALAPSSEEMPPMAPSPTEDIPPSLGDVAPRSITAPFTLTLTAPPASSTVIRCDDAWCSSDGTSYCMRWDGISGINSFGVPTPGEVFTTIGLCGPTTHTVAVAPTTQTITVKPAFFERSASPAATPLRPGSDRMRLA